MTDDVFRQLTILGKIGTGGFGSVVKCRNNAGTLMALKVINIKDNSFGIPSILEPLIMSTLRHPTLNPAIKVMTTKKQLLILQLLAENDLYQWCKNHKPNDKSLQKISFDLLQAIYVLHRIGLIHGDIKSRNILMFDDETIRLTDFSLIYFQFVKRNYHYKFGSTNYRAPEIWKGKKWDQGIDIWSIGCVLYELCGGKLPFNGTNEILPTKALKVLEKWVNNLKLDSLEVNDKIKDIIKRCLVYDKDKRSNISQLIHSPYYSSMKIIRWNCLYSLPKIKIKLNPVYLALPLDYPKKILSEFKSAGEIQLLVEINRILNDFEVNIELGRGILSIWIAGKLLKKHKIIQNNWYKQHLNDIIKIETDICNKLQYRLIGSYLQQIKDIYLKK